MTKDHEAKTSTDKIKSWLIQIKKKLVQMGSWLNQMRKKAAEYISEFMAEKPEASAVIVGVLAFFIANQLFLFPLFTPESVGQLQISRKLDAMYGQEGSFMLFSFWAHIGVALTTYLVAKFTLEKLYKEKQGSN
ncbi:MAG: hypothetical protein WD335_02285 [Candidatus Paceibacterota bacterium]